MSTGKRALLIALVFCTLGMILLVLYHERFVSEASGGDKVRLLVAAKPIEHGRLLTEDLLATHEVPIAYVEDRAVRESDKAKILGLRVSTTVQAQQTMLWSDVFAEVELRRDLSSLVQPGNRAVSLQMRGEGSSVALIKPGDYVDVLAVLSQRDKDGFAGPKISVVLLQKVLVLATGLETDPDVGNEEMSNAQRQNVPVTPSSMVTLSLAITEAQLLGLAIERGKLDIIVRNPIDPQTQQRIPDMKDDILLDAPRRQQQGSRGGGGGARQPTGF